MTSELIEFVNLLRVQRWSADRLEELRAKKLRRLVAHAHSSVPYYRRLMDGAGVRPEDIRRVEDLSRIPITTKEALIGAGRDCYTPGLGELMTLHTSGYSGKPFHFQLTPAEYRTRRLRDFRALLGAGVRPLDRLAVFGPERTRPRRLHRSLGLFGIEVIKGSLPVEEQERRLKAARPDVLWAYPTCLRAVTMRHGNRLSALARPRTLVTSAQVFDPVFRDQITADLPLELYQLYGCIEVGRIAAECPAHRGLHVEADAIIVELLDGDRPAPAGQPGRVVVTSLNQYSLPFIRYELGDLVTALPDRCPCGRAAPLLSAPLGRCSDMVTLPDGSKLCCAYLDFALRGEMDLKQYRFVQHSLDRIEAQFSFFQPPTEARLESLRAKAEAALGNRIAITVRAMDEIPSESFKFKNFLSKLP